MIQTILIPLDGSAFSQQALPLGVAVARRADARLLLVRVHQPVAVLPYAGSLPVDAAWEQRLRDQEREELERTARDVEAETGRSAKAVLVEGPVAASLEQLAEERGADLIVMTTHGRGGLSRAWLGSVADALVRRGSGPILLVHPVERESTMPRASADTLFRRVLVPLDGSSLSEQILPHTVELARLSDAELVLLRIVVPVTELGPAALNLSIPVRQLEEEAQTEAERYLERTAAKIEEAGVRVRYRVVHARQAALAILEQAGALEAELIAMATHGRGGLARLVLGSVADKVLRSTAVPLLLLRPEE